MPATYTFMFADLADSTPLLHQLGDSYAELLGTYHGIVNEVVDSHEGEVEVSEGDGFFCVFPTPGSAAGAAHAILTRMAASDWPQGAKPQCRIGLHTGSATRTPEGLVGLDVHRAARIGAAAQSGQVLLSAATRALVQDDAERNGWQLVDVGAFVLKGISRNERLHRLDFPGLPVALVPPRAQPYLSSTVPLARSAIVGRAADVRGAAEMLLRDEVRLVTITGPGGTGKTRLAIELAQRLQPHFPDGVVFVDLAPFTNPDQFLPTVGRALGIHEAPGRDLVETMGSVLAPARMLIILDNMEQILGAAPEVDRLLRSLPGIRVLATSRSPLRLSKEHEYPLSPLSVPSPAAVGDSIRQSDAVTLFAERAQAVRPDFELDTGNESTVAEITRRLDGLPLAIELAAARLRLFTPQMLLERLDDRLALLDRGPVDAPERHRTLRAAVQWSHDLLADQERVMFRRLGVFAGGWPLEGALAVCVDEQITEPTALTVLEELVAKSLVVFAIDDDGEPRYRMLETLREFSLEKLAEAGEESQVHHRLLEWCQYLAVRLDELLAEPEFPDVLDDLERERQNLREALAWSTRTGEETEQAMWICGILTLYWDIRGYVTEGLAWSERLLQVATREGSPGRAAALGAVGWMAMLAGDPVRSEAALNASDEMWRKLGDQRRLAFSLAMHGMTTYNLNEIDRAEAQLNEAITLARPLGDRWIIDGWCQYGLAHIALARNDLLSADSTLREVLEYSRTRGLTWGIGHAQLSLGVLAFMLGDLDQAASRLTESLLVRRQLKDARGICDCLGMVALLASAKGEHDLAAVLLGAAEVRREAAGQAIVPWMQPLLTEAASSAKGALGDGYEGGIGEGRAMARDEAIQFAIERLGVVAVPLEIG